MRAQSMRRASVELRPYRLQLSRPLRTAHGVREFRLGVEVVVRDGARIGRGDAAPLPELGSETLEECLAELRAAGPGALPRTPAARCGLEQALLDLEAQRAGVPLARHLEARAPLAVPASALLAAESMPELAREAQRAAAEGFGTVKLKVGFDDDYARVAVVRDAVGPEVKLRLDANGAWTAEQALRRLRELSPLGIELCEQPTRDLAGLEGCPVAVAAAEMLASDPQGALDRAGALVLKPMLLGGLSAALELARRAHQRGLPVIVTTSLEGPVGRAGAAHLAAAVLALGPQPAAGIATGRLFAEGPDAFAPRQGVVHIPDSPGLGL
ncbi:MAG TPA: enolase C-terminal domain-like protein [Myxococcales bacterium]|nr:enolase C-terminal domain-like protein [Myxococcales bacterium]